MKKKLFLGLLLIMIIGVTFVGCSSENDSKQEETTSEDVASEDVASEDVVIEEVIIKVDSKGSPADVTRSSNIADAAVELNKLLEERNDPRRVTVEMNHDSASNDEDFNKKFFLSWRSGSAADIVSTGHSSLSMYAESEYILNLDDYINNSEYKEVFDGIYDGLWDATKYGDGIFALPQDAEVRPLFFRKDALRNLGWSEDEIDALPGRIESGEFTLFDMIDLGEEAMNAGVVDWGVYHRPSNGAFFSLIVLDFDGELYNESTKKIIFDKEAIKKTLNFFKVASRDQGVIPEGMTGAEWRSIHKAWVEGDVLFWFGGTWHWAEYQNVPYHEELGELDEEFMFENMGFALTPAGVKNGNPITLTQPYVYMINSKTENPDLAFELITIASKAEYNAKHAVESGHLVISDEAANVKEYKENEFMNQVAHMMNYTTTQPNTPDWNKYKDALYKGVQAVELGKLSVDEALEFIEEQLVNDIGKENIEIK